MLAGPEGVSERPSTYNKMVEESLKTVTAMQPNWPYMDRLNHAKQELAKVLESYIINEMNMSVEEFMASDAWATLSNGMVIDGDTLREAFDAEFQEHIRPADDVTLTRVEETARVDFSGGQSVPYGSMRLLEVPPIMPGPKVLGVTVSILRLIFLRKAPTSFVSAVLNHKGISLLPLCTTMASV
jgi:hypothetical protein